MRLSHFPVVDPWFAGRALKYYYFGYFMLTRPLNFMTVSPDVAYHLTFSTLPAFFALSVYSFFQLRPNKKFMATIITLLMLFCGAVSSVVVGINAGTNLSVSDFWKMSRLFAGDRFFEFPIWSFTFGDLHPHVIAMPLVVATYLIMFNWVLSIKNHTVRLRDSFLLALVWGGLVVVNSWDWVIVAGVMTVVCLFFNSKHWKLAWKPISEVALIGIILWMPIYSTISGGQKIVLGVSHTCFDSWLNLFMAFGHWWILFPLVVVAAGWSRDRLIISQKLRVTTLATVPILIFIISTVTGDAYLSPLISLFVLFLVVITLWNRSFWTNTYMELSGIFFISAMLVNVLAEGFYLIDSTNTLFKFFTHSWLLYLVATLLVVVLVGEQLLRTVLGRIAIGMVVLLALFGVYASIVAGKFSVFRSLQPASILQRHHPGENEAYRWLLDNVSGDAVILEGIGKSYDSQSVILATFTGLSSFIGPQGHLLVRGIDYSEILARRDIVHKIFYADDVTLAYELAKASKIDFILVNDSIRRQFPSANFKMLNDNKSMFEPVVSSNGVYLYKVIN